MRRVAALREGQRVAVHVSGCHLARHGRVLGRGDAVVARGRVEGLSRRRAGRVHDHRRIVHRRDAHEHGRGGRAAVAVAHHHGELVGAVVVLGGRVGVAAVGIHHHGAVHRVAALDEGQRVAINVAGRHLARHGRVLGRGDAVVAGGRVEVLAGRRAGRIHDHGRIVHRRDAHEHGRRGGATVAVAHHHGELVAAVVVLGRRVGVAAVGIDDHGAVHRVAALDEGERVAVHIGGRHLAGHGRVLGRGDAVVAGGGIEVLVGRRVVGVGGHRRVVDGRDGHGDRGRGGAALAIVHRHGEAVGAVVVLAGRVDEGAVGVHHHDAVLRIGGRRESQGIAVQVGRVDAARHGRVFGRRDVAVLGRRRIVQVGRVGDQQGRAGRQSREAEARRIGLGQAHVGRGLADAVEDHEGMAFAGLATGQAGSRGVEVLERVLAAVQRLDHLVDLGRATVDRPFGALGRRSRAQHLGIGRHLARAGHHEFAAGRAHLDDGAVLDDELLSFADEVAHLQRAQLARRQPNEGIADQRGDGPGGSSSSRGSGHGVEVGEKTLRQMLRNVSSCHIGLEDNAGLLFCGTKSHFCAK